jgi:hypothetical protein
MTGIDAGEPGRELRFRMRFEGGGGGGAGRARMQRRALLDTVLNFNRSPGIMQGRAILAAIFSRAGFAALC